MLLATNTVTIGIMSRTFYISDHHFSHANIIKQEYGDRPFFSVEEMDAFMVDKWNSVVDDEDTVIYGGDLTLSSKRHYKELVPELLRALKGHKILVKGNHDRSRNSMVKLGFEEAHLYHFDEITKVLVVHNLVGSWNRISHLVQRADCVLYGHIHSRLLTNYKEHNLNTGKFINICVEHLNYIPRTIEQLIKLRREQLQVNI